MPSEYSKTQMSRLAPNMNFVLKNGRLVAGKDLHEKIYYDFCHCIGGVTYYSGMVRATKDHENHVCSPIYYHLSDQWDSTVIIMSDHIFMIMQMEEFSIEYIIIPHEDHFVMVDPYVAGKIRTYANWMVMWGPEYLHKYNFEYIYTHMRPTTAFADVTIMTAD